MVNQLIVWGSLTGVLVAIGLSLDIIVGYMISHIDMLLGMGLGMTTAPIMMILVKRWRTRLKVNRMLAEIAEQRRQESLAEEKEEQPVVMQKDTN